MSRLVQTYNNSLLFVQIFCVGKTLYLCCKTVCAMYYDYEFVDELLTIQSAC